MTIWKFILRVADEQELEVPLGTQFLSAQIQHGELCVWALVIPGHGKALRKIRIVGTGHQIDGHPGQFLGTVQLNGGALVFHVFAEAE